MKDSKVKVSFNGKYGFEAELLNGSIKINDQFGGYIISTGCGSGKTTTIKEIIKNKYEDGILYCVDTKEEGNKMYKWIMDNFVPDPSNNILKDDIALIHQDNIKDLFNYYQDPNFLLTKKILIITHVRFWTDLINYFIIYNPDSNVEVFDGDFSSLMIRNDLRKYIIFDETPQFFKPFHTYSNEVMKNFEIANETGILQGYFEGDLIKWYDSFYKDTKYELPVNNVFQKIKKECILSCLEKYRIQWSNLSRESRINGFSLHFYPKDLIQTNMKTMVMVWEGAGDILFQHQLEQTKCFRLIDIEQKYSSLLEFKKLEHQQKRSDPEYLKSTKFKEYLNEVTKLINTHSNTLVVVWKDLYDNKKITLPDYSKWFEGELLNNGLDPSKFKVTYYGASNTKSTNDFTDFDSIVLCGDWNAWNNKNDEEKNKFTDAYLIKTNEYYCKLWYFVQLISRIGLRRHDNKSYYVYYSSTFDNEFIKDLSNYFNKNNLSVSNTNKVLSSFEMKLNSIKGLHESTIEAISRLNNEFDPGIEGSIVDGIERKVDISLDKLYEMFPLSRKKKSRYSKFVESLKKAGIILNIF